MQGKSLPKTRRAVLGLVIYEHPKQVLIHDLRGEIGEETDAAILELRVAGLLERDGDYVRPTWAALSYHRLESS